MKGKFVLAAAVWLLFVLFFAVIPGAYAQTPAASPTIARRASDTLILDQTAIGFAIPTFQELVSFLVKFFCVLAGLLAWFYMLWGAISYVTSGGDKEATGKAQQKIIAAIVGVILIVATLAIIAGLEQIVFKGRICFGVTCELKLPSLLKCPNNAEPDFTKFPKNGCDADSLDRTNERDLASSSSSVAVAGSSAAVSSDQNTLPKTGQ